PVLHDARPDARRCRVRSADHRSPAMMLVDADAHVMEPSGVWVERMDATKWGGLIPYYLAEDFDGKDSWYVGGVRRAGGSAIFVCWAGFHPGNRRVLM